VGQAILQNFSKAGIRQQGCDLVSGNGEQNGPGILGALPEFRIEALPDPIRRVIPAPAKVQRLLNQLIHAFHVWPVGVCVCFGHLLTLIIYFWLVVPGIGTRKSLLFIFMV
jgi:hypothetical protein